MNKFLLAFCLLFLFSSFAQAATEWIEDRENDLTTIRLTVTPADEPVPALRHRLTLRQHGYKPGNATSHYLRAFPDDGFESHVKVLRKKHGEDFDNWSSDETPLAELPAEAHEAAEALEHYTDSFFDPASRRKNADWGHDHSHLSGMDIYTFLLPEVQSLRSISRILLLQTRIAIKEHRQDDAINLLRINYQLGKHLESSPFIVSGLVGIGITGITNHGTLEFIGNENSPNLYWALSELPSPPISLRNSIQQELATAKRVFPFLETEGTKSLTYDGWNALWNSTNYYQTMLLIDTMPDQNIETAEQILPTLIGLHGYTHAKQRLIAWGESPEAVEQMAVGQVLSVYSSEVYQRIADSIEKKVYVPFSELQTNNSTDYLRQTSFLSDHPDREISPVASLLLPAVQSTRTAEVRCARGVAALRVIEAIRMHAAQNDGKLPGTLAAISCVPVPVNPATDKPFEYHVENETAILELPESDGFHHTWRYEIEIAQSAANQ